MNEKTKLEKQIQLYQAIITQMDEDESIDSFKDRIYDVAYMFGQLGSMILPRAERYADITPLSTEGET